MHQGGEAGKTRHEVVQFSLDRSKEEGIECVNECTLQVCLVSDHW